MSKISQQNQSVATDFPNLRPSLDLRFALAKKLDPRVTFTRSGPGSYLGADGYLKIAGTNQPRFDHDPTTGQSLGLLIEQSRTNLLSYSNQFENWTYNDSITLVPNSAISPDGTLNAYKQIEGTAKYIHRNTQQIILSSTPKTYTLSVFIKPIDTSNLKNFEFGFFGGDGFVDSYVDYSVFLKTGFINVPGVAGSYSLVAYGAIPYPNGWYRFYVSATTSSFSNISPFYGTWTQSEGNNYQGDGTSSFYVYGAQFEEGSFPTSYIPTDSTAGGITRSSDNASMSGTNFSSWYNQNEGTFYIHGRTEYIYDFQRNFGASLYNSSSILDNRISLRMGNTFIKTNGSDLVGVYPTPTKNNYKISLRLKEKNYNFTLDGTQIAIDAIASNVISFPKNIDTMDIGKVEGDSGLYTNGCINRLTYYPAGLTNQQLINLTS